MLYTHIHLTFIVADDKFKFSKPKWSQSIKIRAYTIGNEEANTSTDLTQTPI